MEVKQIFRYAVSWTVAGCFIASVVAGKDMFSADTQVAVRSCFAVFGFLVCLWYIFRAARIAFLAVANKESGQAWMGRLLLHLCGSLLILAFVFRTLRFGEMVEQLVRWIGFG